MRNDMAALRRASLDRSRAIAAADAALVADWQRWLLGDRPPAVAATGSSMIAVLKRVRDEAVRAANETFRAARR